MINIIIATIKDWNILNYYKLKDRYKKEFNFYLIDTKEDLIYDNILNIDPKYIFFPHWSWIIPQNIHNNFNCVMFHMTDLPFGRGGSPFQNLIMNKIYDTKISALRVEDGIDTGDIYFKEDINISKGSAQENFIKISNIIFDNMIPKFFYNDIIAYKQEGKIVHFKRRDKQDSNMNTVSIKSIDNLYDFIRMLDAKSYPKAYLMLDNFKIDFSNVKIIDDKLTGKFEIYNYE